jgi:predicted RNase H-like HicB family nuclease
MCTMFLCGKLYENLPIRESKDKNMKIIERSKDHFAAYAPDVWGVSGAGETPSEAKQASLDSIDLIKKYNLHILLKICQWIIKIIGNKNFTFILPNFSFF